MSSFDTQAAMVLALLKSKTKLPSLYPQLMELGPLLEEKFGGRSGMPRLLFLQRGEEFTLESRMPNEFFEGNSASWRELSRRESTELRNHLIALLSRWLDTASETMPQKPRALSFRDVCAQARQEFDKPDAEPTRQFALRRWSCFEAAFDLVFRNDELNAKKQLATLMLVPSLDADKHLWKLWPKTQDFVTFASYRFFESSALGVAERFSHSIFGAAQYGKLEALKRFDVDDLTDSEALTWWYAARKEAHDNTLHLREWSVTEAYRDREVLKIRIDRELRGTSAQGLNATTTAFRPQLSYWEKELLKAMLDLAAFEGHYRASKDICDAAKHPTCGKRIFDKLTSSHLVLTADNKKGRTLSDTGLAVARTLTEHN